MKHRRSEGNLTPTHLTIHPLVNLILSLKDVSLLLIGRGVIKLEVSWLIQHLQQLLLSNAADSRAAKLILSSCEQDATSSWEEALLRKVSIAAIYGS